jgi:hypothetical protein
MKKYPVFRNIFLLFICIISLTGCIRVSEEIWINSDNSGKIVFSIGISEQLLALAQNNNFQANIEDKIPGGLNQNLASSNPLVKNLSIQDENKEDYKYKTYSADITDLEKFFNTGGNTPYSISKLDNGNLLFKQVISVPDNPVPNSSNDIGSNLVKAAFAGDYLKVIVHVNDVVKTNGNLNKENNTVEWDIPIINLANNNQPTDLTIEYKAPIPWYIYFGIGVISLILVSVIVSLILFKIRRNKIKTN